jgi:hypothetical protein
VIFQEAGAIPDCHAAIFLEAGAILDCHAAIFLLVGGIPHLPFDCCLLALRPFAAIAPRPASL